MSISQIRPALFLATSYIQPPGRSSSAENISGHALAFCTRGKQMLAAPPHPLPEANFLLPRSASSPASRSQPPSSFRHFPPNNLQPPWPPLPAGSTTGCASSPSDVQSPGHPATVSCWRTATTAPGLLLRRGATFGEQSLAAPGLYFGGEHAPEDRLPHQRKHGRARSLSPSPRCAPGPRTPPAAFALGSASPPPSRHVFDPRNRATLMSILKFLLLRLRQCSSRSSTTVNNPERNLMFECEGGS